MGPILEDLEEILQAAIKVLRKGCTLKADVMNVQMKKFVSPFNIC